MKTKEEWLIQFGRTEEFAKTEEWDLTVNSLKLPSRTVSVLTDKDIGEIQLDAWRQGMTDAAERIMTMEVNQGDQHGTMMMESSDASVLSTAILSARDNNPPKL